MICEIEKVFTGERFAQLSTDAIRANEWITQSDIAYAVNALRAEFLDAEKFARFTATHNINSAPRDVTVGVVCAGNLPLVGFGDMFYALVSGCKVVLKPSSKEPLMRAFDALDRVTIVETIEELHSANYILAMGSDATCALIKSLFPNTLTALRGSMHSIAILSGDETEQQIAALAEDIFRYCSRGCRSVTHLYLPTGYDITTQLRFPHREMPRPWSDCYRYERARATMSGQPFIDGGYYILKEDSPSSTALISYSFYEDQSKIDLRNVQHIATADNFGQAQRPTLTDFANGQSVLEFLRN